MDHKQSVIANVKYQSSKGKGASKLKAILRYVQYRDDRDGHIPQECGLERWVDNGLGGNFQTIATNCEALKSEHVQAFTLVINPNPKLVAFVPEDQREDFVHELTENTIEKFFAERGIDTPEWSYALHRRETSDDGRDNPHTHIILPGTYESWADGGRLPLYFNNRKTENHIEMLHEVAQQEMDTLLQRYVGLDWEQRYDELHPKATEPMLEQHIELEELPPAPEDDPHALTHGGPYDADFQVWVAIQGDLEPDLYYVGFILRADDDNLKTQTFIPRAENLSAEQANILAQYMKDLIVQAPEIGLEKATYLAQYINSLEEPEQETVFFKLREDLVLREHELTQPDDKSDLGIII